EVAASRLRDAAGRFAPEVPPIPDAPGAALRSPSDAHDPEREPEQSQSVSSELPLLPSKQLGAGAAERDHPYQSKNDLPISNMGPVSSALPRARKEEVGDAGLSDLSSEPSPGGSGSSLQSGAASDERPRDETQRGPAEGDRGRAARGQRAAERGGCTFP